MQSAAHDVYTQCIEGGDPNTIAAAKKIGRSGIQQILKEQITGIASPEALARHPKLFAASIAESSAVMIQMKQ